jgi:hypothetical protein
VWDTTLSDHGTVLVQQIKQDLLRLLALWERVEDILMGLGGGVAKVLAEDRLGEKGWDLEDTSLRDLDLGQHHRRLRLFLVHLDTRDNGDCSSTAAGSCHRHGKGVVDVHLGTCCWLLGVC